MCSLASVAVPHIVGTVTLLSFLFLIGTFFQNVYTNVQTDVVAFKLKETTNRVSSTIVDLVSLCFLTDVDQNLTKIVEVPSNIYDKMYTLEIYPYSDVVMGENIYVVRAYLTLYPSTYGLTELPWTADSFLNVDAAASSIPVGTGNIVIHCQKIGDTITIGLISG